jgi:hypothetical protein
MRPRRGDTAKPLPGPHTTLSAGRCMHASEWGRGLGQAVWESWVGAGNDNDKMFRGTCERRGERCSGLNPCGSGAMPVCVRTPAIVKQPEDAPAAPQHCSEQHKQTTGGARGCAWVYVVRGHAEVHEVVAHRHQPHMGDRGLTGRTCESRDSGHSYGNHRTLCSPETRTTTDRDGPRW